MKYVEAPAIYMGNEKSIFLAGGITNCPDWQSELTDLLQNEEIVLLNPRRRNFPINDPSAAREQIIWEFNHLEKADGISFWFPKETLCPITLFEYGKWFARDKPVFIGVHPDYKRIEDIEIQTELEKPEVNIVHDLDSLASQIKSWI
ncbi:MAG: nucleoside 2-deoxyribosyltransferase domain-containing protein [Nanoarchaeota archaeon]|nr:nucleoside 2-deoxyribosyltransferase domain-containing protein [Nanoarchaeota archaeon]MBU1321344.1 nucleoside 2-deoxyribosyltransferase domain-containing protein [Nanoarchaeota archaeon]MBU1597267.1 nucleoside 2-deoxyribosyltransferase domain-containing protein [Nanoarchaeota archaeon]MBU2441481.1 nucleoside 2-deoxyribosyltransferase domain-containing protein [Nanoarchaeota archaeon]